MTATTTDRIRAQWSLDPSVVYLNHGAFGGAPRAVQRAQQVIRDRVERQPMTFHVRDFEAAVDASRAALADVVGADPAGLVFVRNATAAVTAVLRGLRLQPGDRILTTNHAYPACLAGMRWVAERAGAHVDVVGLPWPAPGPDGALRDDPITPEMVVEAVHDAVRPTTRVAVLDHVTSITGLVLPIERLVASLEGERGLPVLVDGAHAPGMLPLALRALGASWYTGNAHKWLCAPRGCALLYVREDRREDTWPLVLSHGLADTRPARGERPLLHARFDWQGTDDVSAWLALPAALEALRGLAVDLELASPDTPTRAAIAALTERNHRLAVAARELLMRRWGLTPPCPTSMLGSLAALPLPPLVREPPPSTCAFLDPLGDWLLREAGVEVPVQPFPSPGCRTLRVSAAPYNTMVDYERLADAVAPWLGRDG